MKIYLCSRVKPEYWEQNDRVAKVLEDAGYEVFVPHRVETPGVNPFFHDYKEMLSTTVCVAVGPFGADCAAEIGWFNGRGIPVIRVIGQGEPRSIQKESPMVDGFIARHCGIHELLRTLAELP